MGDGEALPMSTRKSYLLDKTKNPKEIICW